MEITILAADGSRYDPTIRQVDDESDRVRFLVEHADPPPFSSGDRVQLVLASDTYDDGDDAFDVVKRREELVTVGGTCQAKLSDVIIAWETTQVEAVNNVLATESAHVPITAID